MSPLRHHRWGSAFALVVVFLALAPAPTTASCAVPAASLAWPRNGMEEVPVDAAVILYGRDIDNPSGGWELLMQAETGEPVSFTATRTLMADDYFLIVAVPDVALSPDTGYTGVFSQIEGESMPRELSFRTGDGVGQPPSTAPNVDYQGIGVPMQESDGSWCMYADMEEAGVLAMTFSGEDLGDRVLTTEVRDSQDVKVFDRLLSGALDAQVIIGHGICSAGFPVDPCERYCVRAAALDHLGTPGPWSEWSCSEDIGYYQVCVEAEVPVLFGDDIPDGVTPTDEVAACMQVVDGLPKEDSGGGCAVGRSPSQRPWGFAALLTAFALVIMLRSRGHVLPRLRNPLHMRGRRRGRPAGVPEHVPHVR